VFSEQHVGSAPSRKIVHERPPSLFLVILTISREALSSNESCFWLLCYPASTIVLPGGVSIEYGPFSRAAPYYRMIDDDPIRTGTAGWSVSSRYSNEIAAGGSHLERYARHFNAVEVNSSFYRPHKRKTYKRWADSTPDQFRFSVKLPKSITHEGGLSDCDGLLDRFIDEVGGLGGKLGAVLVQLPPKFKFDAQVADRFFRDLRLRTETDIALEPRHVSWFEPHIDDWLAERRVSRVAADPARTAGADRPGGWKGLAYYRWHGSPKIYFSDYDQASLDALTQRLRSDQAAGVRTWCIFDNTASGAALGNALAVASSVDS
jgi:uncharacterized protein YecE (DUF72 family)